MLMANQQTKTTGTVSEIRIQQVETPVMVPTHGAGSNPAGGANQRKQLTKHPPLIYR